VRQRAASSEYKSLTINDEGLLILVWPGGVKITGPSARRAFEEVNRICAGARRPMLVDMATTKSAAREARAVFGEPSVASRIALLGRSPVDRVIANSPGSEHGALPDEVLHRPKPGAGLPAGRHR